jgi:hypothetical protein
VRYFKDIWVGRLDPEGALLREWTWSGTGGVAATPGDFSRDRPVSVAAGASGRVAVLGIEEDRQEGLRMWLRMWSRIHDPGP